ncbi:MAG: YceI family protein [Bacteriovorax sp.]|nr:YceI family protein [Rhizobacter sp.]
MTHRLALVMLCLASAVATAQQALPAAAAASAPEPPGYALDPTHTFVHWEVVHMGTSTIRGRFDRSAGNVQFDAKAQRLDVGISIDTASVNSGVKVLDTLLRGDSMLVSSANPQAYFTARSARFEGEVPREIRGEFTLRGISQPLSLKALRWNCGLNPLFRREVCGGDFEAQIDRSAFGITHSLPFVADKVRLLIQVEAIRQ